MNQPKDRLDAGAMGLMVLLCAVWGLNQVSIKFADGGIAPVLQAPASVDFADEPINQTETLTATLSSRIGVIRLIRLIPLARIAVTSLSALIRPNTSNAVASIAIGSENTSTFGIASSKNCATAVNPTFRFTSKSLSRFSEPTSNSTNVNTATVTPRVTSACRVIYLGKTLIGCE